MLPKYQFYSVFWTGLCSILLTLFNAYGGEDRPNIVWMVSEDNSIHYNPLYVEYGAEMPNLERLAKTGVVFNHVFSNAPVCSVARSTIISGCYAPRVFAQFHRGIEKVALPAGLRMFPWYLRKAGYYTSNNSKEDYNFVKGVDVWDESSGEASYRKRAEGQPFFHVQNYGVTHEGHLHFNKKVYDRESADADLASIKVHPFYPETPLFKFTHYKYLQQHTKLDKQLGEFLEQLEADGLMDDTIIFYYSDHGGVLPGSKGYLKDVGLHVPLVVYFPEKWAHLNPFHGEKRADGFYQFVDLAPTVLKLAGAEIPDQMDGKPFLGKGLNADQLAERDFNYSYADRFDEKYDLIRSVRKGRFKYIRYFQSYLSDGLHNNYRYKMLAFQEWRKLHQAKELTEVQDRFFNTHPVEALYDLESDPFELNNLAQDSGYESRLLEMRSVLREHILKIGDLSVFPEHYLLEHAKENAVDFGKQNRARIRSLLEAADLCLIENKKAFLNEAKSMLQSDDHWVRYWVITSVLNQQFSNEDLLKDIHKLTKSDPENLVKARALVCLAVLENSFDAQIFHDCLEASETATEALIIINDIVFLLDRNPDWQFDLSKVDFPIEWTRDPKAVLAARISYFEELNQ
ncbi:MAG: sulfatase [Opitutales bacterium]|nr:sulfatase [Opitutales bacterium]